ncbi:hypothetical protein JCM1840_001673 [Sporobolomyces johnsonii]
MPYGETDWSTCRGGAVIEQAPSKDLHAPPSAPPSRLLTTASSPSASPSPFLPSEQPSCVPAMVNMSADKPVHDTSEARQRVLENLGLDEEGEKKDRRVPDGEMRSVGLGMNMPPDDEMLGNNNTTGTGYNDPAYGTTGTGTGVGRHHGTAATGMTGGGYADPPTYSAGHAAGTGLASKSTQQHAATHGLTGGVGAGTPATAGTGIGHSTTGHAGYPNATTGTSGVGGGGLASHIPGTQAHAATHGNHQATHAAALGQHGGLQPGAPGTTTTTTTTVAPKPSVGDKISGKVDVLVGKLTNNPEKVAVGEIKQTEGKAGVAQAAQSGELAGPGMTGGAGHRSAAAGTMGRY